MAAQLATSGRFPPLPAAPDTLQRLAKPQRPPTSGFPYGHAVLTLGSPSLSIPYAPEPQLFRPRTRYQ